MDLRDLAYFEVIANLAHLGRAAERLGRSQPALSKCIDRLESELGATLFEHVGRGLQLTAIGTVLLREATDLRIAAEAAARRLAEHRHGSAGHARIAVSPLAAQTVLPRALSRLLDEAQHVTATVTIGGTDVSRSQLRDREVDIVIGSLSEHDEEEFSTARLSDDEMVIAADRRHPLRGRTLGPHDLTGYGWLLPQRHAPGREWLLQEFARRGLPPPHVRVETNSLTTLANVLASSHLLSFISRTELNTLRLRELLTELPVPGLALPRPLGVIFRSDVALPGVVQRLLVLLTEQAASAE